MSYFDVRDALAAATVQHGAGFRTIAEIREHIPALSVREIAAELGAIHDYGEATVVGTGESRRARLDQVHSHRPEPAALAATNARIDAIIAARAA